MRKINAITPSCLLLCAAATGLAQTQIDLGRQGKSPDFGAASSTRPAKTGVLLPATCSTGELFFKSDAPAGQNLYGCTAPNTWTLQSSGTSSGEANTASNIGGGTFHWFAQKLGVTFRPGVSYILSVTGTALTVRGSDGSTATATIKARDSVHTFVGQMIYADTTTVRLAAPRLRRNEALDTPMEIPTGEKVMMLADGRLG